MITPPPGLVRPAAPPQPVQAETPESITLPPGIADSVASRISAQRAVRPPVERPEIVFRPAPPGMPVEDAPAAAAPPPIAALPHVERLPPVPPLEGTGASAAVPMAAPVPMASPTDETIVPGADSGETVLSPSRRALPAWKVELPNGTRVDLSAVTFVGRDPSAPTDRAGAALLPLDDALRTVSKTHAMLEAVGATLWVRDLHSTNGTFVIRADGSETVVEPGDPVAVEAGDTVEFGEFVVRVERT